MVDKLLADHYSPNTQDDDRATMMIRSTTVLRSTEHKYVYLCTVNSLLYAITMLDVIINMYVEDNVVMQHIVLQAYS